MTARERVDSRHEVQSPAQYGKRRSKLCPTIGLARKPAPISSSTRITPSIGGPGDEEAFAEARRTGKPVLLSVGYAACHWCHVMAHESFEDAGTALVMNELFVNIKVDREERPDVDALYMNALHQLGEQGGWPLTMFLTGERRAVLGRHLLPEGADLRPRAVHPCAARDQPHLSRGAGQDPHKAPKR